MKGDFTRWTYRRKKHYREVNMQQGRTQLDADWNEQNSINFHYERAALQDLVGRSGTPIDSATGYSDGFQIRFANLLISPSRGTPASEFTVDGFGFLAGETVTLALSGNTGLSIPNATAAADGSFTLSGSVPTSTPPGTYTVTATGETSGNAATGSVELTSGPSLELSLWSDDPGFEVDVSGFGFSPGDTVTLALSPSAGTTSQTAKVGPDGTLAASSFILASSPPPATYTVTATGTSESATASFVLPYLSLYPLSAPIGTEFSADGLGFSPGETVTLDLSGDTGMVVQSPPVGADGTFTTSTFIFPSSASPGAYTLTATGESGDTATASLFLLPYFPSLGYTIKRGHYYVDGILCENETDVDADHQADLPLFQQTSGAFTFGRAIYIAYLDVWERHLTYLDDPEIREVALLGPDTATRTKIVWQVKLLPVRLAPPKVTVTQEQPSNPLVGVIDANAGAGVVTSAETIAAAGRAATDFAENLDASMPGPGDSVDCLIQFPAWTALVSPSSGKLTARAKPTEPTGDPCEVPAEAGYTSLKNQLYRLEIHNGGELGGNSNSTTTTGTSNSGQDVLTVAATAGFAAGAQVAINPGGSDQEWATVIVIQDGVSLALASPLINTHAAGEPVTMTVGAPTFKWSRDNGIVVSAISKIDTSDPTATVLTVGSTGKNPNLSFQNNMWVEVTSDINDLWGLPGTLALVTAVNNPGPNTITIDPSSIVGSLITDTDYPPEQHPKIRRWDWDQTSPTPPPYPLPLQIPADNDGYIELEDGVEVQFADGTYRTGDYWLIPARTATADVDWPEEVTAVDWGSVPSGGSDATTLATFLIQRYGLDGVQASDFSASGASEIDASYNDSSGVSHNLSIALNDEQTVATLTVDGIVGAEIPVVTESDGSLSLQCGFPEPLAPEGIEHHYARLALVEYKPSFQSVVVCPQVAIAEPSGGANTASVFLSVSPNPIVIPPGGNKSATITVSYTIGGKEAPFSGAITALVTAAGQAQPNAVLPTAVPNPATFGATPTSETVVLTVNVPSGVVKGCYSAEITFGNGLDAAGGQIPPSASVPVYLTITVPAAFVSPLLLLTDCRHLFPALTDIPRLFYVSGDGQTATPGSPSLPFPLMAAAWSGRVRFTIVQGAGTLTNESTAGVAGSPATTGPLDVTPGSGTPSSIYSESDLAHIAWCIWAPDGTTQGQLVRADYLDDDGNLVDSSPIYYTALLPPTTQTTAATPSATTGLLEVTLSGDKAISIIGPFQHSLNLASPPVTSPPAILLGFLRSTNIADMADESYLGVEAEAENTALQSPLPRGLKELPFVSAVLITLKEFSVEILIPTKGKNQATSQGSQKYILRWWAIPANEEATQRYPA